MDAETAKKPDHRTAYFAEMAAPWGIISALSGGTRRMREEAKTYLPKHDGETEESYKSRLASSTLLNVFSNTVRQIVGQAFANPVSLEGGPSDAKELERNIDGQGTSFSDFGRRLFDCALKRCEAYVLVDMPPADADETRADELRAGRSPYAVFIHPSHMLAFQSEVVQGREVVTLARWIWSVSESDGGFGEVSRTYVTQWTIEGWQRWEKPKDDHAEWADAGSGPNLFEVDGARAVPVVRLALDDVGDDGLRNPPLMDLADKNIEHWQSASDQRSILSFSRFPMLFLAGITEEGVDKDERGRMTLGPRTSIRTDNPQSKASYLEPSGAAIQAGERDLEGLKQEMALLAAQPYISRPGSITATQTALEEGKSSSLVEHWVQLTANSLERIVRFLGAWRGQSVDPIVTVKPEFAAMVANAEKASFLIEARRGGDMSREEFWKEAKALDFVSDNFDPEANEAGIQAEGDGFEDNVAA